MYMMVHMLVYECETERVRLARIMSVRACMYMRVRVNV